MSSESEKLQSQVISFLRFPLIVAVVFIHSNPGDIVFNGQSAVVNNNLSVYEGIRYFISEIVARVAVPAFFFISGFLFFIKTDCFNTDIYVEKLKKRGITLLFPYLCWNLLVALMSYCVQTVFSDWISGNNLLIADYTWKNWLQAFWNGNAGDNMPINSPLWFIRDLMVVVVFSPMVYWGIKRLQSFFILLLGVLWFFNLWIDVTGFSIVAFFFFSMGAYLGINKTNFVKLIIDYSLIHYVWVYIILAVCNFLFREYDWCSYIHKTGILIGLSMFVSLTAYCLKKHIWQVNIYLVNSSFFIYAYHGLALGYFLSLCVKIFRAETNLRIILIYLLCPTIIILFGLWIYKILCRLFPKTTALITGGR